MVSVITLYYIESDHVIMESGKSQDQWLGAGDPEGAKGYSSNLKCEGPATWRTDGNSSSKAGRLETQNKPVLQFESEGTKQKLMS